MSFAEIRPIENRTGASNIRKTEFLTLSPGAHTIRILDEKAMRVLTHYVNKSTIKCLGDDCPICANNKKLIASFPDTFRSQQGYNRASERYYVNVFDKTPAKVCSKCGAEYKDLSTHFCTCGTQLEDAKPLNKIKVLAKGRMLFEHLETIHNSMLDASGSPIGINNFDITIVVSGTGRDATYTPIPNPVANAPVETSEEKFDLEKSIITLTPEEMLDFQRGISLKDIFSARRSKEKTVVSEPQIPQELVNQINTEVAALFQK